MCINMYYVYKYKKYVGNMQYNDQKSNKNVSLCKHLV